MGQITSSVALLGIMECPVGIVYTPVSQLSMPLVGQQSLVLLEVTLPLLLLHTKRVAGLAGPPLHTLGSILKGNGGGSGSLTAPGRDPNHSSSMVGGEKCGRFSASKTLIKRDCCC